MTTLQLFLLYVAFRILFQIEAAVFMNARALFLRWKNRNDPRNYLGWGGNVTLRAGSRDQTNPHGRDGAIFVIDGQGTIVLGVGPEGRHPDEEVEKTNAARIRAVAGLPPTGPIERERP